MKKTLKLLFVTLVMILSVYVISAATVDTTPPVLKSIKVVNSNVSAGGELELKIDATDDISGIDEKYVSIGLYSYKKGYIDNQYDVEYDANGTSIVELNDDMLAGKYVLAFIWLSDSNGNDITYYNEKMTSVMPDKFSKTDGDLYFKFNTPDIVVKSSLTKTDTIPPVLESIEIDKYEVEANQEIKVKIKASDENGIKNVFVDFSRKDDKTGYFPTPILNVDQETGATSEFVYDKKEKAYIVRYKFEKAGEYNLDSIQLDDNYDNSSYYGNFESKEDYRFLLDKEYVVKVNATDNSSADEDLPVLKSVKLNKKSVIAPGEIKIYVEAEDKGSGMSSCSAKFTSDSNYKKNKKKNQSPDEQLYASMYYDEKTNRCIGTIEVNQYTKADLYHVLIVELTDKSGNTAYYHSPIVSENVTYGTNRKEMDDFTFTVVEEFPSDLITSTINKDIVNQIKKEKDKSVIMIDATKDPIVKKEIFEAIQNTNKTIYIEFDGYQWVFKGKDIKNPKDIDVTIKTESLSMDGVDNSNDDYISIIFKDNGELPGKAKIRVKLDYTHKYVEGLEDLMLLYLEEQMGIEREDPFSVEVNRVDLAEDGFYEFEITHNSTYVLTNKEINYTGNTKKDISLNNIVKNVKDGNLLPYCIALAVLIVILVVIRSKKKKELGE